jgi:hypothetical protein
MVTGLFVGGLADTGSCMIPKGAELALITMVDGVPKIPPRADSPDKDALLTRAHGTWEMYRPISWLSTSPKGAVGYWIMRPHPGSPKLVGQASHITATLIHQVEETLKSRAVGNDSWAVLRRALGEFGYILGWED